MDLILKSIKELEEKILEIYLKFLRKNGYVVIPSVLTIEETNQAKKLFYEWKENIPDFDKFHNTVNPHGIFKFHEAGHQEHAWFIRTRPKIIEVFKKLWSSDDLIVSFDGCCYISDNCFSKKIKLTKLISHNLV